ncbi:MAG: cytochrome P460 family protein [Pseudomonadota bacterium]
MTLPNRLTLLVLFVLALPALALAQEINRASFNDDGSVNRPENWRAWVFVGAPLTPNALNGGEAAFPEYHNVYIEPSAFAHWQRTGEWADGTQLAKELTLLRAAGDCDPDPANGACVQTSGQGYFPGEFSGLELKVKDARRFAGEPGNWAYFSFGHQPEPYAETAAAFPTESCNACHEANAETDFVFTQYYPVLRAAKP